MTWTKVVLALALLVAGGSSTPLLRSGLNDFSRISSRVDSDYRLPNNTAPISYVIRLEPRIVVGDFTFDGTAAITFEVLEPTSSVTLHTNLLTINESLTTLTTSAGVAQVITSHDFNTTDRHFLTIQVQNELPLGIYVLRFTYLGILGTDMYGFYRSSYISSTGQTVWLATTQFEATSARRAFPCWDEPALKATFDIGIKHESNYHALSNMPIASTVVDPADNKTWTYFQTTPAMSTYLVAFVVSDFSAIKSADESYNVWSRPNAIELSQYAFDIGSVELAAIADYTNYTYTLPKMDQISIPDFSAGAMENWGLVTYRESMFHYNVSTSTLSTKQTIATVISHEFGHQWFGDLVSPAWWKYLWLNEGFATYFEYMATDLSEDNWRLMDQMVIRDQQADAFVADASANSHPMNQDVASPSEISAIFDSIAYAKSGCVIRMMSHFLTESVFRQGLTKYLTANAYSSATSDDLFAALQEAEEEAGILPSHVYVPVIMDSWVNQMGYPVITVTRNYTTGTTVLSQERFLLGAADPTDDNDYKWWVPLNWALQSTLNFSDTSAQDWIRAQDESVITNVFPVNDWVIVNVQQSGYYRVNYDLTNWNRIAAYLDSDSYTNVHVLNRAALIDDAFNLARADRLSYSVVFQLSYYLAREIDYVPWYAAFNGITYVNRILANTDDYQSIRLYLSILTSNAWDAVGIEESDDDDHSSKLNRVNVINYACAWGLENCRVSAHAKLLAWLDDSEANPISPTLRTNTICAGLRSANVTTWSRAFNKYLTSTLAAERTAILAGLGCAEDATIINNWMNAIFESSTGLTTAASSTAFIYVYQGSSFNVDRALDFVIDNFIRINDYFGTNTNLQTFVAGIAYRLTTPAQSARLEAFLSLQSGTVGGTTTALARSYVAANIAWNEAYGNTISEWVVQKLVELEVITEGPATDEISPGVTVTEDPESGASTSLLSFATAISTLFVILLVK